LPDILGRVRSFGIGLVEITGGEPLLQNETHTLVSGLLEEGYEVLIETNGSVSIEGVDSRVHIILDIKTPSSGMSDRMLMENLGLVGGKDEVKFVISNRDDYEWVKGVMKEYSLAEKTNVLLSPVYGVLDPSELARWMVHDKIQARLNLQIHKYIWGPGVRGV